jgi:hypothetical protein
MLYDSWVYAQKNQSADSSTIEIAAYPPIFMEAVFAITKL